MSPPMLTLLLGSFAKRQHTCLFLPYSSLSTAPDANKLLCFQRCLHAGAPLLLSCTYWVINYHMQPLLLCTFHPLCGHSCTKAGIDYEQVAGICSCAPASSTGVKENSSTLLDDEEPWLISSSMSDAQRQRFRGRGRSRAGRTESNPMLPSRPHTPKVCIQLLLCLLEAGHTCSSCCHVLCCKACIVDSSSCCVKLPACQCCNWYEATAAVNGMR